MILCAHLTHPKLLGSVIIPGFGAIAIKRTKRWDLFFFRLRILQRSPHIENALRNFTAERKTMSNHNQEGLIETEAAR